MQVLQSLRSLIDGSTAALPLPSSRSAALIDASNAALPFPSSRSAALLPTLSTFPEIYKLEVDLRQFTFTNSHTCFVARLIRHVLCKEFDARHKTGHDWYAGSV